MSSPNSLSLSYATARRFGGAHFNMFKSFPDLEHLLTGQGLLTAGVARFDGRTIRVDKASDRYSGGAPGGGSRGGFGGGGSGGPPRGGGGYNDGYGRGGQGFGRFNLCVVNGDKSLTRSQVVAVEAVQVVGIHQTVRIPS